MPKLKDLLEKRNNIAGQMRTLNDSISVDQKWTDEQRTQFKAMKSELEDLDNSIQLAETVRSQNEADAKRERDQEERSRKIHDATGGKEERYHKAFDKMIRSGFGGLSSEDKQVIREARAQSVGTDADGGYTVPTTFQDRIMESMKAYGGVANHCQVVVTSSGNPIQWATSDGTSDMGAFIGENSKATEQKVTFGQVTLGAKKITSNVILTSNELLADSGINMDAYLGSRVAQRIGRKEADAIVNGTGTGLENKGLAASVTGTVTAAGSALSWKDFNSLVHAVDPAYRGMDSFSLGLNDATLQIAEQEEDAQGRPIWLPEVRGMTPATILGYKYFIDQAMADIYAGDWNAFVLRRVAGMQLRRLTELYAESDQVGFLAFHRFDTVLEDSAAIKKMAVPTAPAE